MNGVPKQSLAVLRQIAEFLEGLPSEQVDDLAEGRARLTLIPRGSTQPLAPAPRARRPAKPTQSTVDAQALAARLETAASREEARALLGPLKVGDLKAVATALRIAGPAGTKAPLIKQIVDLTVAARLSGAALRSL